MTAVLASARERGTVPVLSPGAVAIPMPAKACSWHQRSQLGYIAWHEDAERRTNAGERQRRCPVCLRWLWAEEWGAPPAGGPRWEDAEEAPDAEVET